MYIPLEQLLGKVGNEYQLVIVASKRARQLTEGKQKLVASRLDRESHVSLVEIHQGRIRLKGKGKEKKGK